MWKADFYFWLLRWYSKSLTGPTGFCIVECPPLLAPPPHFSLSRFPFAFTSKLQSPVPTCYCLLTFLRSLHDFKLLMLYCFSLSRSLPEILLPLLLSDYRLLDCCVLSQRKVKCSGSLTIFFHSSEPFPLEASLRLCLYTYSQQCLFNVCLAC